MDNNFSLNLSHIPMELKLIMEILKMKDVEKNQHNLKKWLENTDWELFLELTMHHRVYPLLYSKLKKFDESLIPPNVVQTITQTYMMNTFQMLHFSGEMEQVCKLFDN